MTFFWTRRERRCVVGAGERVDVIARVTTYEILHHLLFRRRVTGSAVSHDALALDHGVGREIDASMDGPLGVVLPTHQGLR